MEIWIHILYMWVNTEHFSYLKNLVKGLYLKVITIIIYHGVYSIYVRGLQKVPEKNGR